MPDRQDRQEQWAVFWCSLLGPLLYEDIPHEEAGRFLRELAETECDFPDGTRKKPSRATLWRKWKQYRDGGLEALYRKRRRDRGQPRKATLQMIEKAVQLKKDQPQRSDETINQFLEQEFRATIPKSTLYRHLKQAGATRLKLGISQRKVRRRWTRDHSNALWVGDFEDGPYVLESDRAVPTHLSAFIDCHSRYIVEARYYLRENLDILIDRAPCAAWSVTSLVAARCQPRALSRQRQDLSCQRLEDGLPGVEHSPDSSRRGRSAAGRTGRTLLSDSTDAVGS